MLHRFEAQSLKQHSSLIHVRAFYPAILAYASYRATPWPMTPETTDTEEEGIDYEVIIDNYITAKMAEVVKEMNLYAVIEAFEMNYY